MKYITETKTNGGIVRTYPNGWSITLEDDPYPVDPREWDHVGTMVTWHGRYDLGDEQVQAEDYADVEDLVRELKRERGARCVLPLYLFDHSGLSISTYAEDFRRWDAQGWDWGLVGVIFTTTVRLQEMGSGHLKAARVRSILRAEVEEYDDYLRGDVVGFVVRDERGHDVEACGGFYPEHDLLRGRNRFEHVWEEAEAYLPDAIGYVLAPLGAGL